MAADTIRGILSARGEWWHPECGMSSCTDCLADRGG